MADHAKPILTDNYTNVLSQIRGRFEDQAKGFDPANTAATNIVTGTIRWNSAENKFQKWSGTAWGDLSLLYTINISGNAATVTNGVYTTGDQIIGGVKTFSSTIQGSIAGNAGTVTNGVYTTGDQTVNGVKTFSNNVIVNGNLGIGVTPSAWVSSWKALDVVGGGASLYSALAIGGVGVNAYFDSGLVWRYKTSYAAGRYEVNSVGSHAWYTAPSGTAGSAISFTQVMTLDANGKLILSAANQGIQFADGTTQTTAASSGTYTPTITLNDSGASVSPNSAFIYTKVGNIVTVYGQVLFSKTTSNFVGGTLSISLPINKPTSGQVRGVAQTNATTFVSGPPSFYGTTFGLRFTAPPSSATNAQISLFASSGYSGSVWLADVSFSYSVI